MARQLGPDSRTGIAVVSHKEIGKKYYNVKIRSLYLKGPLLMTAVVSLDNHISLPTKVNSPSCTELIICANWQADYPDILEKLKQLPKIQTDDYLWIIMPRTGQENTTHFLRQIFFDHKW